MILIPGLMSSGEVWAGAVERFKARYECHVLTLAGFAGQPPLGAPLGPPRGAGFLDTVRGELVRYIQTNRLDRPILVGHSLGAFLAFAVAPAHPDLVGPVIAVDGVPFLGALMNPAADVDSVRAQAPAVARPVCLAHARATDRAVEALARVDDEEPRGRGTRRGVEPRRPTRKRSGLPMYEMMTTDLRNEVAAISRRYC